MNVALLITGAAGVGKTTFAHYVQENLIEKSISAYRLPMALEIKRIAKEEFGWDGEKDERGRRLLQVLGTEAGRAYNENIWVNKVLKTFEFMARVDSVLICDDVRFDNEIDVVINSDIIDCAFLLKVVGPNRVELPGDTSEHISEHGLLKSRLVAPIYNEGTFDDLLAQAEGWADVIIYTLYEDMERL